MNNQQEAREQADGQPPALTFEENLARLEEVVRLLEEGVRLLEEGNLTLDRSLELYEEGVGAYKRCHQMLQEAEGKIRQLVKNLEGGLEEKEFEPPGQTEENG